MKFKLLGAIFVLTISSITSNLWAQQLFGTLGNGSGTSTLVELDPDTGALIATIGDIGYLVNGLTYDETTNTLYGTTAQSDATFPNGLISIDLSTAAATTIGSGNVGTTLGDSTTALLAANSAGVLYSWLEATEDDLVIWDKAGGTATVTGDANIGTGSHGIAFDNNDTLFLFNGGGDIYEIDPGTGASTLLASTVYPSAAHHGDFHPLTNTYYGIDSTGSGAKALILIDTTALTQVGTLTTVDNLHTLAFVQQKQSAETRVQQIPSLSILGAIVAAFTLLILGFSRAKKS